MATQLHVHEDGERVLVDDASPEGRRLTGDPTWDSTGQASTSARRARRPRTTRERADAEGHSPDGAAQPPSVDEDTPELPDGDPADPDGA